MFGVGDDLTTAREYLRVSQDRSGRQRSNAEQRDDNRAAWPGFTWGDHYSDASSASRYSKRARDDFELLIGDLRADRFGADALVLWESSRGSRKVGEWVDLLDLCEARGVVIAVTEHHRIYDPANPRDRRSLLEDAVDSEYESAKTSGRVRRSARAGAVAKRPHGRVLFGYRRIYDQRTGILLGQEPHPDQAPIVRGVFDDYLGGRSARSIAVGLNEAGVRTNRGNGWTLLMVQRMLTNRAYIGRRIHKGEDYGQGWDPLVDEETFEAAQKRREAVAWRKVRKTSALCSGVARCGVCRAKLQIKHGRSGVFYGCPDGYHAYRRVTELDAWVTAAVVTRLTKVDVGGELGDSQGTRTLDARRRRDDLRAELDRAMALWHDRMLSVQAYAEMEADLLPQIRAAEAEIRRGAIPLRIDVPAAEAVPAWWDALTLEVRREVVAALLVAVVIDPAGRGARRIGWRDMTHIEWRR